MDARSETAVINKEVWSAINSVRQREASRSERIRFLEKKSAPEESGHQRSSFSVSNGPIAGLGWMEIGI